MLRACKLTLKFLTKKKRRAINALLQAYRSAVNFYIRSLWIDKGKLDKQTLERLSSKHTRLSARYKSQALKQALDIVISTRKSAKQIKQFVSMPIFNGSAILHSNFICIDMNNEGMFDLIIRLSYLKKGKRLVLPIKRTAVLNKWLSILDAEVIQGCSLSEDDIVLWVNVPDVLHNGNDILGIDIGVNKLLSLSDGTHIGVGFKILRDKINRKRHNSKAKKKALRERNNYINYCVNKISWQDLNVVAIEDLKGLSKQRTKRSKAFRKAMIPWTYRRVIEALKNKSQENGVHLVEVEPAYTSQTCPKCETVSVDNRKAEKFVCINCGFSHDADTVGAINILKKALLLIGSLESPMLPKDLMLNSIA